MALANSAAEILRVRMYLTDAGIQKAVSIKNELRSSDADDTVYVNYTPVVSVTGVWLSTDPDHTATNYYTGGSFEEYTGKLTLGSPLAEDNMNILVNYTYYKGLVDTVIDEQITNAKTYVEWYAGETFDWTATADSRLQIAIAAMCWRAATGVLMALYAPDVIQKGFNFSIAEFKVESKTWAGSMGIRDLLALWDMETMRYLALLGRYMDFVVVSTDDRRVYYRGAERGHHGYHLDSEGDVW